MDTVFHNGATVNYLFNYDRMRDANVLGTNEVLRLAFEGRPKEFNYVSTTFVFGWAVKSVLYETDFNKNMELLDFGYSQSKWVAEQVVADARSRGLSTRIFRPALVSPSITGGGNNFDIAVRLVAFMVNHGIGVDALNQVSFVPADIVANNIVAISTTPGTAEQDVPRGAGRLREHAGYYRAHYQVDRAAIRNIQRHRFRSRTDPEMPQGRSALSAARFSGGLGRQHHRDGVQTLRQFLLSGGSGCLGVGKAGSVARRYGQRHSEIHAPQGDHLGRDS